MPMNKFRAKAYQVGIALRETFEQCENCAMSSQDQEEE